MRISILTNRSITCAALLCVALFLPGCAQDAANLQQARDATAVTLQQAQAARDQVQQQLSALPADDPVRKTLQPQIDKLDQIITKAQTYLPLLDAALKQSQSQSIDPSVQAAVGAIPYGSLALALFSVIVAVVKHMQAGNLIGQQEQSQKAFQQIVQALDAALPNPSPEQKAKVDAVLDTDVKARVAAVRA